MATRQQSGADARPVIGFDDSPMCAYCKNDSHVKLGCPVRAYQEKIAAEQRESWQKWDQKTYGGGSRRRAVRRGR